VSEQARALETQSGDNFDFFLANRLKIRNMWIFGAWGNMHTIIESLRCAWPNALRGA